MRQLKKRHALAGAISAILAGDALAQEGRIETVIVTAEFRETDVQDTPIAITLVATDVDGDALVYSVQSGPTNGLLSGDAPNLTYTPSSDYFGSDSFDFVASDAEGASLPATVSITVTSVMPAKSAFCALVESSARARSRLNLTSSASIAVPSWKVTPPARWNVYTLLAA